MFYMFHHIPKCGGTSFNKFLESVFNPILDYHNPGGPKKNEVLFERYCSTPVDLLSLSEMDCVSGHYNMDRIFLKERYPHLEKLRHKKFSIIRDPFEAAKSGVYFNIKRGVFDVVAPSAIPRRILSRANFISKLFGIQSASDIDEALSRYWFIAPLNEIDKAAKIIEKAAGRKGCVIDRINTTVKLGDKDDEALEAEFRERSALDYEVYHRACSQFERFVASRADLISELPGKLG